MMNEHADRWMTMQTVNMQKMDLGEQRHDGA